MAIKNCKHILYADDTTIYLSGTNPTKLAESINKHVNILSDLFKANKLALNTKKNIVFSNRRVLLLDTKLFIDGKSIAQVSDTKFLGDYLDDSLT